MTSSYHQRYLNIPGIPKTTAGFNLQEILYPNVKGDQFVLPSANINPPMIMFSTTDNLRHLASVDTTFCDGTFYTCPTVFNQLNTIHALVDGSMYPLVYNLLPGKDTDN